MPCGIGTVLVRFVLSWQPDMAVMAPVELRERVQQKMLDALKENY
jgi:predicted DNA-binding transcriptional regulator YafY